MKRFDRYDAVVKFRGEDGSSMTARYDNRGEPFRQGVTLSLDEADDRYVASVFIEDREAKELRDLLNKLYPVKP